jgi:hypothetical protein
MPLPYAPPPKDSKVYRDLKNLKISGVTADQMDTLKGELFAQGVDGSEDEMRRLNLLGQVSGQQSNSGPLLNTFKIVSTPAITSSTTTTIFQPDEGEVWICSGMQMDSSGGSGSVTAVLLYSDGASEVRIEANSTSGIAEFNITSTAGPLYVTNGVYLAVTTSSVAGGEQTILSGAFMRVR